MNELKFIINKNSTAWWDKDKRFREACVKFAVNHINTLWRTRKYLYLNQLYEEFGSVWDVNRDNECFKYDIDGTYFDYTIIEQTDDETVFELKTN